MPIYFTIIISGYKKTALATLQSCMRLTPMKGSGVEVVFVDNTHTALHRESVGKLVVDSDHGESTIRYIHVPVPGKASAQNIAIRDAKGKFIICLDDDVLPDPELLVEYYRGFNSYPCGAIQGRVELQFEGVSGPPRWLDRKLRLDLAEMDFGRVIYPFEMGLTGASMAFRREIFERYGLFDERLGPGRTGTLEDQEFSERIRAGGETQLFWPAAAVRHRIPPARLRLRSFARIHYDVGYSDYLLSRHLVRGGSFKFMIYVLRQYLKHSAAAIRASVMGRQSEAIFQYCELYKWLGYYRQYMRCKSGGC